MMCSPVGLTEILLVLYLLADQMYCRNIGNTKVHDTEDNLAVMFNSSSVDAHSDATQLGIDNIVRIVQDIEAISSNQQEKFIDQGMVGNHEQVRHDNDYHSFPCDVKCFLHTSRELSSFGGKILGEQRFLLDCVAHNTETMNTAAYFVSVHCVSHFTGGLIHVALDINNEHRHALEQGYITVGNSVAKAIIQMSHVDSVRIHTEQSIMGLYLTFNLPIMELTYANLKPLKPWLKYIALNGQFLRLIDEHIVTKLNLDYFMLEGCDKHEFIEESFEATCLVVWRFSCPNSMPMEITADRNTQHRLCRTSNGAKRTKFHVGYRPRRKRAADTVMRESVAMEAYRPIPSPDQNAMLFKPNEQAMEWMNLQLRRDFAQYQKTVLLLLSIIILLIFVIAAILISFRTHLRKAKRIKIKPV